MNKSFGRPYVTTLTNVNDLRGKNRGQWIKVYGRVGRFAGFDENNQARIVFRVNGRVNAQAFSAACEKRPENVFASFRVDVKPVAPVRLLDVSELLSYFV